MKIREGLQVVGRLGCSRRASPPSFRWHFVAGCGNLRDRRRVRESSIWRIFECRGQMWGAVIVGLTNVRYASLSAAVDRWGIPADLTLGFSRWRLVCEGILGAMKCTSVIRQNLARPLLIN
ncbi:hypothetical protein KCP76_05340 [Salmonella enterica subsp. enterica serovar Weltevreden]|nr:hypothetical protein KCP76_05340 [Salmonella enterica subsp. enterica serovar Weltevreden]